MQHAAEWRHVYVMFAVFGPIANLKGHYFQPSLSVSLSVCVCVCLCVSDQHFSVNRFWRNLVTRTLLWSSLAATIMVHSRSAAVTDLPFWFVDFGGPKLAQVQSYSPGGSSVPSWRQRVLPQGHHGATWRIRLNCLSAAEMHPYVKLSYFDHLLQFRKTRKRLTPLKDGHITLITPLWVEYHPLASRLVNSRTNYQIWNN